MRTIVLFNGVLAKKGFIHSPKLEGLEVFVFRKACPKGLTCLLLSPRERA
jgi:hypothetical protein